MELNTNFSGSYDFLKWIIKDKYKIYGSCVSKFFSLNNYVAANRKRGSMTSPLLTGVSNKTWNLLYKDLIILNNMGYIEFDSLEELEEEYYNQKKGLKTNP
jgi:hypothetical protein